MSRFLPLYDMTKKTGVWLLGAFGGVATTTILGLAALRRGRTGPQGLVSQLPAFANLDLLNWDELVVGGHDIRSTTLYAEAMQLARTSRAVDPELVEQCRPDLDQVDACVRPGVLFNVGPRIASFAEAELRERLESPRESIGRVQQDLRSFAQAHGLEQVIVVNVASTEPPVDPARIPERWHELAPLLDDANRCPLSASSLYAIAALELGYPYINFTPSAGSAPPALQELALARGTCHMGHDGKTGETLLKSALAPMFANRNLEVMSWVGHNIFGNMDGKVLDDPANKRTKVVSRS
ncbi:MAG: inositol-3-phosphate synthase, partial [Pirellulaceae bacterium]